MWQGGRRPGRDQSRERGVGTARSAHAPGSVRGVGYHHPSALSLPVNGCGCSKPAVAAARPHMLPQPSAGVSAPPAALGFMIRGRGRVSLGPAVSSWFNVKCVGDESFFILTRLEEFSLCVELVCRVLNRTASPNNGCTLYLLSFVRVLLYPTPHTTERRHPDERRCREKRRVEYPIQSEASRSLATSSQTRKRTLTPPQGSSA